jgi:hypothetical protein
LAYKVMRSDSDSDAQGGVLGAIGSCHKRTRDWENDLLDVVRFFQGRPWEVVELYCTHGALERLEQVGLVKMRRAAVAGGVRVEVQQCVEDFCQTDLHHKYYALFTELHPDNAADLVRPTWVFLLHLGCLWPLTALPELPGHIVGRWRQRFMHSRAGLSCLQDAACEGVQVTAHLGSGDMGAAGFAELSRCKQLRILHFDGIALSAHPVKIMSQRVRWISAHKVKTPEALHLQLSRLNPAVIALS